MKKFVDLIESRYSSPPARVIEKKIPGSTVQIGLRKPASNLQWAVLFFHRNYVGTILRLVLQLLISYFNEVALNTRLSER